MALIQVPAVSTLANAAASNTISLTATQGGSSIVVALPLIQSAASGITYAVTDNQGNVYLAALNDSVDPSHAHAHMLVFWCQFPVAGVTTITVTATGGTFSGKIVAYETPALTAVDQTGVSGVVSAVTTATATAGTTDTGINDFVVALMSLGGAGSNDGITSPCTGGAAWSVGFVNQVGTVDNSAQSSYRFNAASVANSAIWSWSASQSGKAAVVSFQVLQPGGLRNVGVSVTGIGTQTAALPIGWQPGDKCLLLGTVGDTSSTASISAGWTQSAPFANAKQLLIWERTGGLQPGDVGPTLSWSDGSHSMSMQTAAFNGNPYGPAGADVLGSVDNVNTSTALVHYAGFALGQANALVIAAGRRIKTATSNGANYGAFASQTSFVKIADIMPAGSACATTWSYWIQGAATALVSDTQTLSITDSSLNEMSVVIAFGPVNQIAKTKLSLLGVGK